jgi:hypothetical protein
MGSFSLRCSGCSTRSILLHAIEALEPRRLLTTYYVSTSGSDSNSGTSTSAPWASVAKVDATTFAPGDTILFQRGDQWHGDLIASSSGTAGNPITYADYGNESLARPTFDGSDIIPNTAFTLVSGSTYSFNVASVPNAGGNAYWVYSQNTSTNTDQGLLAASASDNSSGGVESNSGSFYINGSTVYVNTGGVNPTLAGNTTIFTLGDRGAGTNANSSLIDSNGYSYITFENLVGRETAEVGGGNSLTGGINDGYVYRIQGGSNVTLLNDDGEYGSKHIFGAIDTTGFLAQGDTAEGGPEGVSGNNLGYGNATAMVAYADNAGGNTGDTQVWLNDSVSNYDPSQPGFYSHDNDSGDIASLTVTNFSAGGTPVSIATAGGETINYTGGSIPDNTLIAYAAPSGAPASPELFSGISLIGNGSYPYPYIQVNGDATVQNCLVTQSNQPSIQVYGASNTIRFNTLDPIGYATGLSLDYNSSSITATNETIYGNLFTGSSNAIAAKSGDTYTADYDFFDSTNGSPTFAVNGGTDSLAQFQAAGYEQHAVTGNPAFTNTAANDFSLQSTSPAINIVPTSFVNPAVTTDIRGYSRPSANIYDAGAYEYQSVLHQPTIATAASASPNPVTGTTTNLSVLGASQDGEATLDYTWSLTGTPPAAVTYSANGTNASKNTTATFTAAGTYNFLVTVSNGQYSTTSAVTVTVNQVSQGLQITPSQFFVPINTTEQFTAAVVDQFGNPINGAPITYSIQNGGGSINSSGLFSAPGTTGTTIILATSGSARATATANVVPPNQPPTVATAASCNPNPVTGTTAQLSVLGADDNGEANLTYTWSLTGTPPATVSYSINGTNAAKNTTATFTANGQYNFLVTIKDSNGSTTTSSVTVTVNTFVPVVVDGTLDGSYGKPIVVQTVATNYGNNVVGTPASPYSQLSAAYGQINESNGQFDLFLAGSLDLVNAHLDLLIDSVPGEGATNLSTLNNDGPWSGSSFTDVTLDSGFQPDHIFTFAYGGGYSLSYYNFDTNTDANENLTDPATGLATSSGVVPYFTERVNNAAENTIETPSADATLTTGAEFAFSLSGLGYTSADYAAGDPIGVMALISYGSHTEATNQWLAPLNPSSTEQANNPGEYYGSTFDLSNNALFPGNQFFDVPVPAGPAGPTVATAAAVNPNPVTGATAALSVLGADSAGESTLTYTWSTTGTPPAAVSFTANGTNASKNTTATFTANGTYNFLVTIQDQSGLTTTSTVSATVTGVGSGTNQPPTVSTAASATPSPVTGTSTALSVLGADDGGESNLTYTWATTGTPPAAISFSANGTNASKNTTATFTQAGTYNFQVTITDSGGLTTTSNVSVTVDQTPTSLSVTPSTVSLAAEQTQQFAALVKDQFGTTIASPSVTWSVSAGTGSISGAGLYTAPAAAGTATVKAVDGSASGTAAVTITSASAPTVATAASATPSPVTGTTTLSVLGADSGGESNLTYTWATTGTPPAAVSFSVNGTNASKNTTATFTQAGTYNFQVTITNAGGVSTTSSVSVVVDQTPTSLSVTPSNVSVVSSQAQQFGALVVDQFGATIASAPVNWSVSTGAGTISATGLYTAPSAAGAATVEAADGSVSGTAAVTITSSSSSPITVDGTLDGQYGSPLATQTVTTNIGSNGSNGVLGSGTKTAYTQLSAAYGVIDESTGYFYLFLAGSLSLNNQHLNILIDSVPGQGATNLNALANVGPYNNGSGFSNLVLDNGFQPDYIITSAFGTGTSINYYNFDTGASGSDNVSDPSTTEINTGGSSVPLFYEKVNNAAVSSAVTPANAGSLTTGAEFAFSLSGLGYTAADYNAGDKIGVMALVTFGSFTQFGNQSLAPLNETAAGMSANGGSYFQGSSSPTDFSNAADFPGNQFFPVAPATAGNQAPTVATAASANPNPVTGTSTNLSVLGADAAGESTLTYTWSVVGTPPSPVSFTANGSNAAKNTTASFSASGTYNFLVTIADQNNLSTTSSITVNVTAKTSTGITLINNGSSTSNATQALSYTAAITGGVPNGETVLLEDASNNDTVIATAQTSNGSATFSVPAGTLLAGTHNLIAVYGGDSTYASSTSSAVTQIVQVVVTAVQINGNLAGLVGAQRSVVDSIVYTFSEAVNIGASAFAIAVHPGQSGTVPTLSWTALNPNTDGSSAQWVVSFSGAGVTGNSIANGVYDLTMNAAAVSSDANATFTSQSRATDTFYRLFGDYLGTERVNATDYNDFLAAYNSHYGQTGYVEAFDVTGTDQRINATDYNDFLADYNERFSGFTATI